MEKLLVSACLLGRPVRYDGRAKTLEHALLARWQNEGRVIPVCPEVSAGFPTPRPPAEIASGASAAQVLTGSAGVFDDTGRDVTEGFREAARLTLDIARRHGTRFALLTDGSPSCGSGFIYSGAHDGLRRPGRGVVAELLSQNGIRVFAPDRIGELARALEI